MQLPSNCGFWSQPFSVNISLMRLKKEIFWQVNMSFMYLLFTQVINGTSRSIASIYGHTPLRTVEIRKKIFLILRIGGCLCVSIWFILYYMFTPDGKKRYEKRKQFPLPCPLTVSPSPPLTCPFPHTVCSVAITPVMGKLNNQLLHFPSYSFAENSWGNCRKWHFSRYQI